MYAKKNIPEIDFKAKLKEIAAKGFIKAGRTSDTAIGYTIEKEMGIKENNVEEYDFTYQGLPVELKAQRVDSTSNITLFTKEPEKGKLNDKLLIQKYGYKDIMGRNGLKITIKGSDINRQDFKIGIDNKARRINLVHSKDGIVCYYEFDTLFNKLQKKIGDRLLLVFAKAEKRADAEYFHYMDGYYLQNLNEQQFIELIKLGKLVIEFRMHLKEDGSVRNHGTAFRLNERELHLLYEKKEELDFTSVALQ